ncbi:MAG: BMP family ABC transporter substrate-binding protein [Clostridia bacterium]|nr:BMP family ABC transporter substrate-binding protein [Clostridia bacterium]
MKKIASVLLVLTLLLCSVASAEIAKEDVKVGLICLHDENMGYDANFIDSMKAALANIGLDESQLIIKTNIPESQEAYDAAADLADMGCQYVFADSFGHEDYIIQAASEFPEVQFSHATGTKAQSAGLENYHNAFASIYEGRFAAGVAAGLKLNEMIESGAITEDGAKIGYVGAFPYAEVISGYTSFFLGARTVCPSATMTVKFTNSWGDQALEQEAATALIASGCVLMSEHADTIGAPTACEDNGVPNVGYNVPFRKQANTWLISSRIDWAPYMQYAIESVIAGESFETDWSQGFNEGSVALTELNENVAAEGTAEKLDEVIAAFKAGELHVFDTSTFTVNGLTAEEYVQTEDYLEDTANGGFNAATHQVAAGYVTDGYFHESEFQSAPYFDLPIDGITLD